MFGTLRFVLALLVVATHVGIWIWPGVYAVSGFYVISGYLMCLVLNRRYGFSASGLRAYGIGRFLRIFPPYWVACALSAAFIWSIGEPVERLRDAFKRAWPGEASQAARGGP